MYCFCVYCCQNCADVVLKDYLERLDDNSGEDDDDDDEAFEPYPTVSVQDYLCVVRTYVCMYVCAYIKMHCTYSETSLIHHNWECQFYGGLAGLVD